MKLALIGIEVGLAVALALNRVWTSWLYGVSPVDPEVLGGAAALLMGTALVASYLRARRATKVDPMAALRRE
jgi:putative ABC transport system permease protein